MLCKTGVRLEGLTHETVEGLFACAAAFRRRNLEMVVTSANDSHGWESLHSKGRAFDLRLPSRLVFEQHFGPGTWDTKPRMMDVDVQNVLRKVLGPDFDVVLERHQTNPWNWHLHVEFDPA